MKDNDIISVERFVAKRVQLHDIPNDISPDRLLGLVKENPHLLPQFLSADPELGNVLASSNIADLRMLMMKRHMSNHKMIYEKKQEENMIWADPDNEENQKKIAERIRMENVQKSMETAIEEMPEAFGRVIMLYVDIEVNGFEVKAFVDSGAQSTIMSIRCAERCNIARLIDVRFAGEARGVGTSKILGRVHMAQMRLGKSFFPISITILENNDVDFLLGLDMLKRHRCCIDLMKNVLRVEGGSGVEEISFLGEADIPGGEKLSGKEDHTISSTDSIASHKRSLNSDEESLKHLTSLGFTMEECITALAQADGDVELAATLLYASRT